MSRFPRLAAILVVCLLMAAVPVVIPRAAQAQGGGQNLLVDGDFEAPPTWPQQDGIGEVQVAPGWRAWFLDKAPAYVQVPANCNDSKMGYHCYWMRPEFRDNVAASFANRVHSGVRSQKYFSAGRMHEAGLYQQVGGIKPGSLLHFAIYIQAWMCYDIDKCGKYGVHSDNPANMHLRVGIDPTGGTDPFSPNIVWSPEQDAFDRWVEFSVEAKAAGDTVTVFTHSRADWDWARNNNDVYLDDASLVVVSGSAASGQALASAATNVSATSTMRATLLRVKRYRAAYWHPDCDDAACYDTDILGSTVLTPNKPAPVRTLAPVTASTSVTPTASISVTPTASTTATSTVPSGTPRTYVIVEGDTLAQIAQQFNTTVAAIMQANDIANEDMIYWGQTLIIP